MAVDLAMFLSGAWGPDARLDTAQFPPAGVWRHIPRL